MNAWEQLKEMRAENAKQLPSLGAELKAMAREAVKDVRQTMNEVFFGQGEHAPEMGTPLNPTPYETTEQRQVAHSTEPGTVQEVAQNRDASHGSFREMIESRAAVGRDQNKELER